MRQKCREFGVTPHFEFKKDTPTKVGAITPAFVPLQAADFLAYEVLKVCKQIGARAENFRWGIKEFQKMQGEIKIATPQVLIESASKQHVSQGNKGR